MRLAANLLLLLAACGASQTHHAALRCRTQPNSTTQTSEPDSESQSRVAIAEMLDDWHRAAATADEERYFLHFTADAVFLGTDATERWNTTEFREFAHPFFERGRAWTFRAVRRDIVVAPNGRIAWFHEDLETENLGPCRGSGVLLDESGTWKLAQYNLAITVPNERFDEVKALLETATANAGATISTGIDEPSD